MFNVNSDYLITNNTSRVIVDTKWRPLFAGSSDEEGDTDIGRSDVDDDGEEGMQPPSPAQDHTKSDMLLPNNDAVPRRPRSNREDVVTSREPSPKEANNGATIVNNSEPPSLLPSELEVRGSSLYTRMPVPRGTRYGPYMGKWMARPLDQRFSWEVRLLIINFLINSFI